MSTSIDYFDYIRISIASPERVLKWSYGEVTKPETINYRTLKPERDGLFCERIFGPTKDWECYCGKYKRVRHKGIICERCGVEVTDSKVRRHRMGHISLAAPVSHIWFLKGIPSYLGLLLDMTLKDLEQVIYFNNYVVIDPADSPFKKFQLLSEEEYEDFIMENEESKLEVGIGAEAIKKLLGEINVKELAEEIRLAVGIYKVWDRILIFLVLHPFKTGVCRCRYGSRSAAYYYFITHRITHSVKRNRGNGGHICSNRIKNLIYISRKRFVGVNNFKISSRCIKNTLRYPFALSSACALISVFRCFAGK